MGFGFEHVDDEAARRLRDLADHVQATLANVGIPVSAAVDHDLFGGAVITVDTGADEAGGFWPGPPASASRLLLRAPDAVLVALTLAPALALLPG